MPSYKSWDEIRDARFGPPEQWGAEHKAAYDKARREMRDEIAEYHRVYPNAVNAAILASLDQPIDDAEAE